MDSWISLAFVLYLQQSDCSAHWPDFTGECTLFSGKNNWGTARGYKRRERPSLSEAEIDDIFLKHHGVPLKSPFSRKSVKQAHLFSFCIISSKRLLALQGITWLRSECFLCLLQMCLLEAHPSEHQRPFTATQASWALLSLITLPLPREIYVHSAYQLDYRQVKMNNPICSSSFRWV